MDAQTIIAIVLGILLLVAGGIIKKVWGYLKAFIDAVHDAIQDGEVNDVEIVRIIDNWKVLGKSISELVTQIISLIPKRH